MRVFLFLVGFGLIMFSLSCRNTSQADQGFTSYANGTYTNRTVNGTYTNSDTNSVSTNRMTDAAIRAQHDAEVGGNENMDNFRNGAAREPSNQPLMNVAF